MINKLFVFLYKSYHTHSFYFLLLHFFISSVSIAQTTLIPDVNFEQELIDQGIDTNGLNGNILDTDAQSVTSLDIGNNGIIDITGINAFTNLTALDLGNNQIPNVNLNGLTQLISFNIDDTEALVNLDLTQNILLEDIYMETNANGAFSAPIAIMDLSQNINLVSIELRWFKNLTDFILPVTNTLTHVNIRYLADPTLDFSLLDGLENLQIRGSDVNTTITLPNEYNNLNYLRLSSIDIPTIDISNYINLEAIYFWGTYVENLILPNSTTLEDIFIILHNIQNPLDFSIMPNLTDIDITSNQTTPLVVDLTQNLVLEDLDLSRNDINTIDVTQNVLLEELKLNVNNLTSLDVTQNVLLDRFEAYSNQLPEMDVTQNVVLNYLILRDNLIPTLDVTQNIELRSLDIGTNLFTTTGLDLTQNVELTSLTVNNNQIESLDITQNIELYLLDISYNLFPGNDILNQYYNNLVSYLNRLRGRLIANNNLLTGDIPDFYGLYDPAVQTRRFHLFINENRFEFGHFENQHLDLVDLTSTQSIGPSPDVVIQEYYYAPQAKVDAIDTINVNAGDSITLTTVCAGTQNHYTWFKDGIEITDAPDSPNYTITSVNSCDAAVYHSEITSDLVPFENTNPPGTDGKNLLLIRNDITLNVNSPAESCVTLTAPVSGSTNIALNETLFWSENLGACGYFLSIGTTSGGTDILNNVDVGNVSSYNTGNNFPPNTQIYVTITPYFYSGVTLTCPEESFTTGTTEQATICTTLVPQYNGTTLPVHTNLEWLPSPWATGYFITIGTSPNAGDIINMLDVGNITTYNPTVNLAPGTQHYVTITPYNGLGSITGCNNEFFYTESIGIPCTYITMPTNLAVDVPIDTDLNWNAVTNVSGYNLSIGTTSGGSDIINNLDVGNVTTYNLPTDLPNGTQIYVTILPYNALGIASGCIEESFTTIDIPPSCTNLNLPVNGAVDVSIATDLSWTAISNATGYYISVGTMAGTADIINNLDVGNVTTYNLPTNLPDETEIFISITPYNNAGNAMACIEESFTTEVILPLCTTLITPLNTAINVPIDSDLSWNPIANATGYIINIGTTSGGNEIISNQDVGNVTIYNPANDLPGLTQLFITITPYNSVGNAIGCAEASFTTALPLPSCSNLITPVFQETNVSLNTVLSWNAADYADGYIISMGTITGASDIMAPLDVGNVTSYTPLMGLPNFTQVFVTIQAYNATGTTVCGDDQFTTEDLTPLCVDLTFPVNGQTDVAIFTNISWQTEVNAEGYYLSAGTTSGGIDLVNTIDVGNITTYNFLQDLPQNTQVFITIIPYNFLGEAIGCNEQSFTTQLLIPECTSILSPFNGEDNVSVAASLSWLSIDYAEGYILSVGSSQGGTDIVNAEDLGNVLNYVFSENLPDDTIIYVTITAYNAAGNALNCSEANFQTEIIIPECTTLITPFNNETEVLVDTMIVWNSIYNATGYFISIGTNPNGADDIIDTIDIGNITSYQPQYAFVDNTTIYVNITPYNSAGNAIGCIEEKFTTENRSINTPLFFTPNGDAFNPFWQVDDPKNEIKRVHIFDRLGKLITSFKANSIGWDGTFKGSNLPTNDYWYVLELYTGGTKRGHFTLKR